MAMIEVKDLCFSYGDRAILKGISFTVQDGEFISILGCNGVGKSTLFRCMLALLTGYTGQVLIDGQDTKKLSVKKLASMVAYIPQNSASSFNYSVEDIVLMGTTASLNPFESPKKNDVEKVNWALEKIGISHLSKRCYHHISGGERQLVIIARALVQNARVLMLDEPTASLDYGNQMLVLNQARALADEGYTLIQTTHNPEQSYMFSDRILALKDGRILSQGLPGEVMTQELVSSLYGIDVVMNSMYKDRVRVCTPRCMIN